MTADADAPAPLPDEPAPLPDAPAPLPDELSAGGRAVRAWLLSTARAVAAYTRLEIREAPTEVCPPPALVVANHGFGGLFDLNVFALAETFRRLGLPTDEPAVFLTHQLAWTMGVGPLLDPAGFLPAGHDSAARGFAGGRYVIVLPGGDVEAAKPWPERNRVKFAGRTGFARLAIEHGVPIVPVVVIGTGESLLVLSDGQGIARRLGIDRLLRNKTFPITLSVPWGLNAGLVGVLPYLPLPSKLTVAVLDPVEPDPAETPAALAARVHDVMQAAADRMAAGRRILLG